VKTNRFQLDSFPAGYFRVLKLISGASRINRLPTLDCYESSAISKWSLQPLTPGKPMEPNDTNVDASDQFTKIESCLASIRAASWVTAIGVIALVFFYIK